MNCVRCVGVRGGGGGAWGCVGVWICVESVQCKLPSHYHQPPLPRYVFFGYASASRVVAVVFMSRLDDKEIRFPEINGKMIGSNTFFCHRRLPSSCSTAVQFSISLVHITLS